MNADVNNKWMRALGKFEADHAGDQGWSFLTGKSGEVGYEGAVIFRIGDNTDYGGSEVMAETIFEINTWVHIVGTYAWNGVNGGTGRLYANGAEVNSQTNTDGRGVANTTAPFYIGWDDSQTLGFEHFDGILDEVRVSDIVRSADWIAAQHLSMTDAFITIGSEEASSAFCKKLVFNNAGQTEDLINFPVLVTLYSSPAPPRIDYNDTQDNGEDIRFIDGTTGAELSYEIEEWNELGDSLVWVNVPQIDGSSTTDYIWLHHNNPTATDAQIKSLFDEP